MTQMVPETSALIVVMNIRSMDWKLKHILNPVFKVNTPFFLFGKCIQSVTYFYSEVTSTNPRQIKYRQGKYKPNTERHSPGFQNGLVTQWRGPMYISWQTVNQKDTHSKKDGLIVGRDKPTNRGATRSYREYTINAESTARTIGYR